VVVLGASHDRRRLEPERLDPVTPASVSVVNACHPAGRELTEDVLGHLSEL
jgi:hypothetical protein